MGIVDGVASWFGAGTSPQEAAEAEEVSKYSDECFLLDYIDVISQFNRNDVKGLDKVYQNFIPIEAKEGSGAYEIISRLTIFLLSNVKIHGSHQPISVFNICSGE